MKDLYRGTLVRLATESPEVFAKAFARWSRDSEYHRLADGDPAQLWSEKKYKESIEKEFEKDAMESVRFSIRTLADDKFIGEISLWFNWQHGDAWVGIVIGEREYWGQGYGTDAMRLIVQYGFEEANLRRVSLALHSYNPRALKSYEKVGFKMEGTVRGETQREGRRTDSYFMGILREEWLALQGRRVMKDLLKGKLVQLSAVDPEEASKQFVSWDRDSEFRRLLDSGVPRLHSAKAIKAWLEKELGEQSDTMHWFTIRTAADNQLLGDIVLDMNQWNARDSFVGIGIGPRDFWGKGYGTEAMQLILQYAFLELNLRRVTLTVFEYNQRGIRSYEKAGFRHEGRQRQRLLREGKRWDMLYMGILREDWIKQYDYS